MTEEEQNAAREQEARARAEYHRQQQEFMRQQQELQGTINRARQQAQERQQAMDTMPRRKNVIIAAVDQMGGYSKDGKIPWNYPGDLKWFQQQTTGHVCVMGKTTYLDLVDRLGEKAADSVLPNRKCFVVSSTLNQNEVKNAIVIKSIYDVEMHLTEEDVEKRVYFIGGGGIFRAALSLVDVVVLTTINKVFDCDKSFPYHELTKLFSVNRVLKNDSDEDLRFVEFVRKQ